MEEKDGVFRVHPPCRVTERWAVFLYALGIEPDTNATYQKDGKTFTETIVSPSSLEPGVISSSVNLEIPGEVFCHVINLFGEPEDRAAHSDARYDPDMVSYNTAFGLFSWSRRDKKTINVKFSKKDDVSIDRTRTPFGPLPDLIDKGSIVSIIPRYQIALSEAFRCSDGTMVWPDSDSPLEARLAALHINLERLESWRIRHDETYYQKLKEYYARLRQKPDTPGHPLLSLPTEQSEESRALIFSADWVEEASRVARRATTQRGRDRAFLEDCLATLRQIKVHTASVDVDRATQLISQKFFFENDAFFAMARPKPGRGPPMRSEEMPNVTAKAADDAIYETIEGYTNTPDPWKKQLYDARVHLKWLLLERRPNLTYNPDVVRYISSEACVGSDLWKSTVIMR